ncbi:hypothetical protein ABIB82_006814 [Bradyrhizobium sp. i1.8.4]|uniref:pentapeptide repeat-containing protein n=1 Tax=unclassified Bradyrhizobium TaxID=2631580 RepID=UPI003D207F30
MRADLEFAQLQNASLANCNLSKADLAGADLSGANLAGADFTEADLASVLLPGATALAEPAIWTRPGTWTWRGAQTSDRIALSCSRTYILC